MIHSFAHSFFPLLPSVQQAVKESPPCTRHEGSQNGPSEPRRVVGMSQGPTQDHQPWYQRACGGVSQRHSGTPLLCLQSLGGAPQQQPLGMATSVKGLGELVPGWPALAHPCPLASVHSPTQTPLLAFSLPQVTPSPAQPPGASVLPLGPLKLPPSGWSVSEQALLLCPGAIQGPPARTAWTAVRPGGTAPGSPAVKHDP